MALRFAVASEDFGTSLKRAINAAARAAVPGVRLNARTEVRPQEFSETALRQLLLYVQEHRMQVAGLMFSTRHALQDPLYLDQRLNGIRTAMPLARSLGTSEMIIRVGRIPDPDGEATVTAPTAPDNSDVNSLSNPFSFAASSAPANTVSDGQQFQLLAELLNDLVRYGNHVGCTLQLQLGSYQPERIRRLLAVVKSGPVGIVFDTATCAMTGADSVSVFRELHSTVGYIRGRDAQKDVDGAGIECAVGTGNVDWTAVLPTFAEAEYNGWCCIERTGGDDRADDVLHGVQQLKQLLPGGTA
jgi:sugar phosphate isomerase/epimerase